MRVCRGVGHRFEDLGVLVTNTVGGDVLGDFLVYRLFVGLIDLNDLFDLPTEITCQECANSVHVAVSSAINLHAIVAQCLSVRQIHEAEAHGALNGTGIEQDSRDPRLPLHLVEEL